MRICQQCGFLIFEDKVGYTHQCRCVKSSTVDSEILIKRSNLKGLKERCNDLYEEDFGDYTIVHLDKEVLEACFWLIERYEKALNFYADKERYKEWDKDSSLTDYIDDVDFDGGDIARKALEGE